MTDARTYGLTLRAAELLAVIRAWKVQHGCAPTYDEMAAEMGMASRSSIHRLIGQLEYRGLVRRLHGKRQSVEVVQPRTITLPEDVALSLRHAAREAGRTPEEHVAALVRSHCPSPSPF